ncbi:MAG: oligoendopeptidase F [Verrucomicrobiales bacterium]
MSKTISNRTEIPEADKWDLSRLYPSPQEWEGDFQRLEQDYPKISQYQGRLGESAQTLLDYLELDKSLDLVAERLGHFAHLQTAEEGSNNEFLSREARLNHLFTRWAEAASFVTPELQSFSDELFAERLKDPVLSAWTRRLERLRRFKPHTLTQSEERLLALAHPSLEGHSDTFGQLTNVDMRFPSISNEEGDSVELSHAAYSGFLLSPNRDVRKAAFHQYYSVFQGHRFTLASCLASSVRADVFLARARNHSSALEAALFPDVVPVDLYKNLIASVRANLQPLHEYYQLRRRLLEVDEIHVYDTYVPVVRDVKKKTSFDEAIDLVCDSLHPLGEAYVSALAKGLKDRWCDRYESRGKRSGAFSSSSYGNPPYILMNYQDDVFSDIYTLSHEAGHSMHTFLSMEAQTFQDYHYPIFLAEVASTFNEELLTHHLLQTTEDPKMRAYILNRQIDDIRATLYRQTMFAEFEMIIHEHEEAGEALTLDAMTEQYHQLLQAYFGADFVLDEELSLECLRIPHFYSAFYVYKYATGIAAAMTLADEVLADQTGQACQRYLKFLSSGGSQDPIPTLQAAGVDLLSPEPVERALKIFHQRTQELETLLA